MTIISGNLHKSLNSCNEERGEEEREEGGEEEREEGGRGRSRNRGLRDKNKIHCTYQEYNNSLVILILVVQLSLVVYQSLLYVLAHPINNSK